MTTNILRGLQLCFISPAFYHLAAAWLPISLLIDRDLNGHQALATTAFLAVVLASLGLWLRDLSEYGDNTSPDDAPCSTPLSRPAATLSWANVRNGIHLTVGTGHRDMHPSRPITSSALLMVMAVWALSGNSTLLTEGPVLILAMAHIALYVCETNAVGEHADMGSVNYREDGTILDYTLKSPDGSE